MRRVIIFFYWFFKGKNNVGFAELWEFLLKPQVRQIADRYLNKISDDSSFHKVTFHTIPDALYWPKECAIDGIYQVTCETFDPKDWHYYQKEHTEVQSGEILLDIGAAEGLFALSVANLCKKILLVEPNDYFVHALNRTFVPYQDKVIIYNVAVGDNNGEIIFNPDSLIGRISIDNKQGVKKRLSKIDDLIPEIQITYLKADLEGFEIEMLKGAEKTIKRYKPKIAITAYHRENETHEIISLLKKFVPEYKYYVKGISQTAGKPVMIHFWIPRSKV